MRLAPILAAIASLAFFPAGAPAQAVLVTGYFDSSVQRYDLLGNPQSPLVPPGGGGLSGASSMTLSPDGNTLFASSPGNDQILKYNPANGTPLGSISLPAGSQPSGLKFGPDGNLYVSFFGSG